MRGPVSTNLAYQLTLPSPTVFHCPSEVTPNVSEVLVLLASMDDDDDWFPVLLKCSLP